MKKLLFALTLGAVSMSFVGDENTSPFEGFSHPESVVGVGKYIYVSNFGEEVKPTTADDDGFISQLDFKGKVIKQEFITGLNAPKGMVILGDVLYVADIDEVKGYSLKKGEQVFSVDFTSEKTKFLNDLVMIDKNTLLVSATDVNKVYKVKIKEKDWEELTITKLPAAPNGMAYDEVTQTVYICTYGTENLLNGEIGMFKYGGPKAAYKRIGKAAGQFDGIAKINETELVVSDWRGGESKGMLMRVNKTNGKATDIKTEGMEGPADFYFDEKAKMLYVPALLSDKVYRVKI